ncbi:hypothetical protein KIN20_001532 [Parelaphostrongylus tenuis]|uniref:Uncharacterized protein n=1 Tax=Parelaphostrongylus tenuis TaxID=148309 RepID=A0AAD5MCX7_PARTN|nr:hypothetical protein KIN20_001532 [Parelaphostrongylus tenuis]
MRRLEKRQETTTKHSTSKTSKANALIADTTTNEEIVIQPQKGDVTEALILAGEVRVLNRNSKKQEKVYVVLDTGADRSFTIKASTE